MNLQEPTVAASNSNIHDQVKLLIERRTAVLALSPWVGKQGVVDKDIAKLASLPEVLGRVLTRDSDVEDLLEAAVEVGVHVVTGPLKAKGVEALGEIGAADLTSGGGAPESIELGGRA